MNHMLPVLKAILPKNVGDVVSGKVNPEYLGVICPIIVVALFLPGAVENHVSRRDDVLLALKIKVPLPGGDIEQLKIYSPSGTMGGEFCQGLQAIGATASHKEWVLLVFKVDS